MKMRLIKLKYWHFALISGVLSIILYKILQSYPQLIDEFIIGFIVMIIVLILNPVRRYYRAFWALLGLLSSSIIIPQMKFTGIVETKNLREFENSLYNLIIEEPHWALYIGLCSSMMLCLFFDYLERNHNEIPLIFSTKGRSSKKYFIQDCKNLLEPIREQIDSLNEFLELLNTDTPNLNFKIIHNLKDSFSILERYDYNELRKHFHESNYNSFNQLWQYLKRIEDLIASLEQSLDSYVKKVNDYKPIIRNSIHGIFEIRDELLLKLNQGKIDTSRNLFLRGFFNVCESHMRVNHIYKYLFGKESLIDPLFELREEFLGIDDNLNRVTPFMMDASNTYSRLTEQKNALSKRLNNYIENLERLESDIGKNLSKM